MKKGIFIVILYGLILYFAFLFREPLLAWLEGSDFRQLPMMFLLAVLFGTIPIIPFTVFAGLMGAKYGILIGTAINWTGSVGAATIFFILARYFFINQFQHYISRFNGIKKFDSFISQNAFVAVLFTRMIPIVPPPVVNIYSGLSSMPFKVYFLATAIGKIPGMIVYAYLGNQLFASTQSIILGIVIYGGFITIVIIFYRRWYKQKEKIILD
jgi:uncharacterized membrane protein YdjX (TVP38/TMEM64 family)